MQPESPEATHSTSSDQAPRTYSNSSQHGLVRDVQDTRRILGRDASADPSSAPDESDTVSITSGTSSSTDTWISGRLSERAVAAATGSQAGRIEQYERSTSKKHRKRTNVEFQVVPSSTPARNGVSIETFPNEVLTHMLSHLPPPSLSDMSLVSKRFHGLITSPHAWRIAFSRYFPCQDATVQGSDSTSKGNERLHSDKRSFSRLTALASWRSEYILRTRLLSALRRGKPTQFQYLGRNGGGRSQQARSSAVTTYTSGLVYPINCVDASWGTGLNKRQPHFIHGASEQGIATLSDPGSSSVGTWGLGDYQAFKHFADIHAGETEYGLGAGEILGMPNVLDVSQLYGKIYGEASPGGRSFFTSIAEQRGRWLSMQSAPERTLGVPEIKMAEAAICSVWIAKSESVLKTTNGLFGMLVGTSHGILGAYALGNSPVNERRFDRGELTAKWAICPGVPIVALKVDENISSRRLSHRRIWAVLLNALGEVYYLSELPTRPETKAKLTNEEIEAVAWQTGRSVSWNLLENTRRLARIDPFDTAAVDGSYTPKSSSQRVGLSVDQLEAETKEIERFLQYKPKHFRKICEGWDCRQKLLVDFDGDSGESIMVISCGFDDAIPASVTRYTRRKFRVKNDEKEAYPSLQERKTRSPTISPVEVAPSAPGTRTTPSPLGTPLSRCSTSSTESEFKKSYRFDWYISDFTFGAMKHVNVTATTSDESIFATLAAFEDPLLGMTRGSSASSPVCSPFGRPSEIMTPNEVPGQRARFMAVGTDMGDVFIWDVRAKGPPAVDIVNSVMPINIISTDSPEISCLAMTSLYLVHGGNDGLVQAWDPLASRSDPIRTLNSRFSSRARRRLVQAQNSVQGVGNNYYAAGAIILDPDPTVLRGIVSMGTHLRYWSYSSSAADQYKGSKRRLKRRSERGSNASPGEQKFSHTGRGALKDYIANEKLELDREKASKRKEKERMSGRYGTDLLGPGASEEEMLAYATMLSAESYTSDEVKRRGSAESSSAVTTESEKTIHEVPEAPSPPANAANEMDPDIAEAIRLSLLENHSESAASSEIPISYSYKSRNRRQRSPSSSPPRAPGASSKSPATREEENDLDFALQLSLAEENSRLQEQDEVNDGFPALSPRQGKGKGRL